MAQTGTTQMNNDRNHALEARQSARDIEPEPQRKRVGTIDFTPTWRAIVPIIIAAFQDGTDEAKRLAKLELDTMAEAADRYNASCKD
jgi:hypothetical protein